MTQQQTKTEEEFGVVTAICRDLFIKKLKDYGASWRMMRPCSLTDQIYIKVHRIRTIEQSGVNLVGEGIYNEFVGIVNYGIISLIQLYLGEAESIDIDAETAVALYDKFLGETVQLMLRKNHDYGEAWRMMRVSSYTDIILQKVFRTKQIEDNAGKTLVSEGVDANYMDMVNYSLFALIKLTESAQAQE